MFRIAILVRRRGCGTGVCGHKFQFIIATLLSTTTTAMTAAGDRRLDQRLRELEEPDPTSSDGADQGQTDTFRVNRGPEPDAPPPPTLGQVAASQVVAAVGNALRNFSKEPDQLDRI